ncbi:MAG: nitroreductase family protein [Firmicutes bacterium]|nr:nitroreductase family protein [Bacillota bacterium]
MDLFDAIFFRKSTREYADRPLSPDMIENICRLANQTEVLYKKIPLKVKFIKNGMDIQNITDPLVGRYSKVKAPHYLVITSEKVDGYLENVGYAIEHLVLELTSIGIGTCWIGGMVKKPLLNNVIKMGKSHIPVIIIGLGAPLNEEALTANIVESKKRKEIKEFVEGPMDKILMQMMDAVRLSPSSMNSQPWRFFINDSDIDVYTKTKSIIGIKPFGTLNKIDIGIALCHFSIAAKHFGVSYKFEPLVDRERNGLNYITTIHILH